MIDVLIESQAQLQCGIAANAVVVASTAALPLLPSPPLPLLPPLPVIKAPQRQKSGKQQVMD